MDWTLNFSRPREIRKEFHFVCRSFKHRAKILWDNRIINVFCYTNPPNEKWKHCCRCEGPSSVPKSQEVDMSKNEGIWRDGCHANEGYEDSVSEATLSDESASIYDDTIPIVITDIFVIEVESSYVVPNFSSLSFLLSPSFKKRLWLCHLHWEQRFQFAENSEPL